jgi:predicted HicB family RNase H-like nuclease
MEYKGYTARIEFDDSVAVYHGRIVGIRDVITFEAESADALQQSFEEAVEDYLAWCAEEKRSV